ncbi:zinc finger protein [Sesbania bispinosa]|nr:zinc finger protein [Sesbania bispinosa]
MFKEGSSKSTLCTQKKLFQNDEEASSNSKSRCHYDAEHEATIVVQSAPEENNADGAQHELDVIQRSLDKVDIKSTETDIEAVESSAQKQGEATDDQPTETTPIIQKRWKRIARENAMEPAQGTTETGVTRKGRKQDEEFVALKRNIMDIDEVAVRIFRLCQSFILEECLQIMLPCALHCIRE